MSAWARRAVLVLVLGVVPLALVGRSLRPGRLFLPVHPAAFEPLASEDPARAARAAERANLLASDALFPVVSDLRAMRRALAAGSLPTWDPLAGIGMPLAAQSLVSPWYPLRWPELAFGERMLAVHALASLVLAGLGMALFLRARGHSQPAVIVGALAFQASGFAVANLHLTMKVDAALWLPWALWAVEGALAGRRLARVQLAFALGLACLAGFPPIAFFVLAATGCYALARLCGTARKDELPARRIVGGLALALLAGLSIGAISWVPMAEASALSLRGARDAADLFAERLPVAALSTLVLPNLFGGPSDGFFAPHNPLAWWLLDANESDRAMIANALEWNLHAGIGVLLLAFAGIVGAPRRAMLPAAASLAALGFAFGWPLARLFFHLPGLDLGAPARAAAIAWTFWPVLAAVGVDALVLGRRRALATLLLFGLGMATFGQALATSIEPPALATRMESILAARYGKSVEDVREWTSPADGVRAAERLAVETRWLARFAFAALAAGVASYLCARRVRAPRAAACVTVLWGSLVLGEGARLAHEHLAPRAVPGPLFPESRAIEAVRAAAGGGRVLRHDASSSGVGEVLQLARPDMLGAYGIADLTPYVIFPPRSLVEAFRAVDPAAAYAHGFSRLSDVARLDHPLLDLLRVRAILSLHALENPAAGDDHPLLAPEHASESLLVYRRSSGASAAGLAWVVPVARRVSAEEGRALTAAGEFSSLQPWIVGETDAPPAPASDPWAAGEIVYDRPAPHRLDASVRDSGGGWLIFSEQYVPGWKATVDGEDAEVFAAYGFLRAVAIPPGDSIVRTKYEPWSLRAGASITLAALGSIAWWMARERRQRPGPTDPIRTA